MAVLCLVAESLCHFVLVVSLGRVVVPVSRGVRKMFVDASYTLKLYESLFYKVPSPRAELWNGELFAHVPL